METFTSKCSIAYFLHWLTFSTEHHKYLLEFEVLPTDKGLVDEFILALYRIKCTNSVPTSSSIAVLSCSKKHSHSSSLLLEVSTLLKTPRHNIITPDTSVKDSRAYASKCRP